MDHPRITAVLAAILTACGSDQSGPVPTIEDTTFAAALGVDLSTMTRTSSGLYFKDLAVGTGATAASGHQISVHYTGWLADGTQFDQNGAADDPFSFVLDTAAVIPGWDQGIGGMKVGGRRQLVVPPALGYGAEGNGPIPPNAILVFVVEVVAVQ